MPTDLQIEQRHLDATTPFLDRFLDSSPLADDRMELARAFAAFEQSVVKEWKPIETAPTDGTEIIVGLFINERWVSWIINGRPGEAGFGYDGEMGQRPTHWRSSPKPPPKAAK